LLGDADAGDVSGDGGRQYRVTTLSATTLYDRVNCTGDDQDEDDDDDFDEDTGPVTTIDDNP